MPTKFVKNFKDLKIPLSSSGPGTTAKVTKVRYKTKYLHLLVAYVSYWPHEYDFNLHRMYLMGFWSLIYKNLSCTIDDSILICKSNLKRGKTISVDRMSYRAAIVNPRQARPPHCHPTASAAVAIATMFYFAKSRQNPWVTTIYVHYEKKLTKNIRPTDILLVFSKCSQIY